MMQTGRRAAAFNVARPTATDQCLGPAVVNPFELAGPMNELSWLARAIYRDCGLSYARAI